MENMLDKLILENTDMTEREIYRLDESAKSKVVDKIATKLFQSIKRKALDLDFAMVDATRGDVTKLKNYSDITNAIKYLNKIYDKKSTPYTNELKSVINTLEGTVLVLNEYQKEWTSAYSTNSTFIKYMYESMVIGLIQSTSFTISETVQYVNNGFLVEGKVKQPKNLKRHNSLNALKNIVEMHRTNKLRPTLKKCLTLNESMAFAVLGLLALAITNVRALICMYFKSRRLTSQYLLQLSEFVRLNMTTVTDENIKKKQSEWVKRLEDLSVKINIDQTVASSRTDSDINEEDEELEHSTDLDIL